MSATVEQRILSMKFDNKQFESGVGTSLNTLAKLDKSLELKDSAKGLNNISEAAKRVSFDGMASGVEVVKNKFSALEIMAITALSNITNSAINTGKRLVSSLTIDPIKDGFKEYETQMNAIQTVLANTSSKGTTLKDVNNALAELNEYSDKTIYNFTEMTKNIGTFTAAGVDLKTSTAAIKGIANLAAVSGSNSQQASTAMYQLSQALASGTVKLQDWNSVVNAGMGGEVFQKSLIETAKVHGVSVDSMIKKEGSFRETLKNGWLTSQILTETLSKFTGDLNEKQLKSMGYTDKQIKEIIKMGKMANDAATKVKTFSQLMDTLKEAVGSGWAQTWQIVFGDFEEAKVLFTSVSDVIGGMITNSSKARNDMLKGWKDLGGRKALIDSIKNAFEGTMGVVKAISEAFKEIFPPTTSKQLYDMTVGLKNFTEHLKLSDATLAKLKSTFKGVFAIFDIGKTILSAVANAILILVGGTGDLAGGVLSVTGSIGEWIVKLDQVIKKSDIFNKVLTSLAHGIKNGLGGITSIATKVLNSIGSVITTISKKIDIPGFEFVHSVLNLLGRRMTSIGQEANTMSTTVGNAFKSMAKSAGDSKVAQVFKSIWETIKKVSDAIGILINKMLDSIINGFQNADFGTMLDAVAGMSIGGMLIAFKKFMTSLTDTITNSNGILANAKGILDGVRGSLESYQQNLKASILLKIGIAISLLAASIVAISLIDSGKLVSSLAAIGTLFGQLLIAMKLYSMIGEFKGKVIKSSIVMLAMSTSILILSHAMDNISKLDWNGVAKGAVGITVLAGVIVGAAKILSTGEKAMIKGSLGMVIFAEAIKILASACIKLATLDWNGIAKGLVGVGVLMAEISLFLNTAKFSSKSISTAIGIVILSEAIRILASACANFANLSWSDISKGLTSVGVLLTELAIFSRVTSDSKNMISTGIGLIGIATAMKILASAMTDFGGMSWESISKGLIAMGGALSVIAIAANTLPPNLPATATGLVIMGAALNIIASALVKMGGMSWDSITKGMVTLGGALTILSVALNTMTGTLAGSAALLVAAGALALLAPALALLGAMTWESIIKGLVDLAATIGIFALSAALLSPIIPSMFALSGSLVLLGVAMVGIGAGLTLVGVGLAGVATGITLLAGTTAAGATAIVASLSIIITGVAALIPAVMTKVGEGIIAICKVITEGMPEIMKCVSTIIKEVINCIVVNTPIILNGVFKILSSVLDSLIKWVPTIVQKVSDLIIALLKVIADNVPRFVTSAVDIILALVRGIDNNLNRIIDAAFKLIITFINGLANAIRNNSGAIGDACLNLVDAIVKGIASLGYKFVEAGANAVKGFVKGLLSMPGKIVDAGKELGQKALDAAKKALSIHSPSKKFGELGKYSAIGYIDMLKQYGNKVAIAGSNMGHRAISGMTNAISGVTDMLNGNIDSQPVIRPVMDLTDIQNGSNQLYGLINGFDNSNLNGSMNIVDSTANQIRGRQLLTEQADRVNDAAKTDNPLPKKPVTLQLILQNGKVIAEYLVDDMDRLLGDKNQIAGRRVGV